MRIISSPAVTTYLYITYLGESDDVEPRAGSVIVIGGWPYRIGSSVEFDWCCVNAVDCGVPLFTNLNLAMRYMQALEVYDPNNLPLRSW